MFAINVLLVLAAHVLRALAILIGSGGPRALIAENLLLKPQLLVLNRARNRAPRVSPSHRLLLGFWCQFLSPRRIVRSAVAFRPSSLLRFHEALRQLKYRRLYSPAKRAKPGPKGPSPELIQTIVDFKRCNPRCGCPRIAQQISKTFAIQVGKDVVRRVLASHYLPRPVDHGPSWLTFLGHSKDSLWSLDLFQFKTYFNGSRVHQGIGGEIPDEKAGRESNQANLQNYSWKSYCNGLFEMPIAA